MQHRNNSMCDSNSSSNCNQHCAASISHLLKQPPNRSRCSIGVEDVSRWFKNRNDNGALQFPVNQQLNHDRNNMNLGFKDFIEFKRNKTFNPNMHKNNTNMRTNHITPSIPAQLSSFNQFLSDTRYTNGNTQNYSNIGNSCNNTLHIVGSRMIIIIK